MMVYTVLRHIDNRTIPLRSFCSPEEAEKWAELQMKFLDKEYFYSIAVWETELAPVIPCKDKRLRLVK
jgi:hypothetical protein